MSSAALDKPPRTREAAALDEAERALFRLYMRARGQCFDQPLSAAVDECGVKQALDRIGVLKKVIRWPMLLDEWESQFEDEVMPDIMPSKGDVVAIGNLLAEIGSKTPAGDYEIVLSAEPRFRATIKIADFDWSYAAMRWEQKMVPVSDSAVQPALRSVGRVEFPAS